MHEDDTRMVLYIYCIFRFILSQFMKASFDSTLISSILFQFPWVNCFCTLSYSQILFSTQCFAVSGGFWTFRAKTADFGLAC